MNDSAREEWKNRCSKEACFFCPPRPDEDGYFSKLKKLDSTTLYLHKDQGYLGYCVLILDIRHCVRASQLTSAEWASVCEDLRIAQIAIEKALKPDHINIAALGNMVAHLHWHIVPRFVDDGRWGAPIYTTTIEEMKTRSLPDHEFEVLKERIVAELT